LKEQIRNLVIGIEKKFWGVMSWYERVNWNFLITVFSTKALALIEAASPD
jgi:hypothetical protein